MLFERVAVIGVGLIGGSFALALKQAGACAHVAGAGRNAANLRLARERGVIDSIAADAVAAAHGADLVLLAAPVAQFPRLLRDIAPVLGPKAVVTDGGSTKRDVIAAARQALGRRLAQFVPAHPIAGAEKSGAQAAQADLFRGKRVILTPLAENTESALKKVQEAWSACGARITRMDAGEHDAVLAAVSHLPHLAAFALVHDIAGRENAAQLFSFAAGGFRDFTRIASSHPEMWRDICLANRDRLLEELKAYRAALGAFGKLLEAGDGVALERAFGEAREARNRWLAGEFES
ncbi:MAG TPA: prephenate dehydrogenase/arogenate dehydrogenase family protein [Burkholderiales bacterium]|nr:prephenate dehydrogenase/arogenate dehydrogenase family protein [Burkholderiales bacterium]